MKNYQDCRCCIAPGTIYFWISKPIKQQNLMRCSPIYACVCKLQSQHHILSWSKLKKNHSTLIEYKMQWPVNMILKFIQKTTAYKQVTYTSKQTNKKSVAPNDKTWSANLPKTEFPGVLSWLDFGCKVILKLMKHVCVSLENCTGCPFNCL